MPLEHNIYSFIGAAVLGVFGAASMYLIEHYRQEKLRNSIVRDVARLEREMANLRVELRDLQTQRSSGNRNSSSRSKRAKKGNSIISASTTDDYQSVANLDSSDLEFYDVSDDDDDDRKSQNLDDASSLESVLIEIDQKLDRDNVEDIEEMLRVLEDLCVENPSNAELLYRIGKAHHKLADANEDSEISQKLLEKGIEACNSALNFAPENANVHKWYAVLIGSKTNYMSLQERLSYGLLYKKHVDTAISINPNDASLHYMLGRFDFDVANLKWYERKVVQAFHDQPVNASYSQAWEHFSKAESLIDFEWKDNRLMLAKCKFAMGEYKEGLEWLEKAQHSRTTALDGAIDREVDELLKKYANYR